MKGDFSRIRFNPASQYTAVVKQQGRVDLDSDDLEQHAIDQKLRQNINSDVIGPYGGQADDAGFQISVGPNPSGDGYQILIGPGRYYVQGIPVENQQPAPMPYDAQPYLIDPPSSGSALLTQLQQAGEGSTLGLVLQVWQRLVTALDDPSLLEPALGQADTTVRLQTVWQVIGTLNTSPPPATSGGGTNSPISQLSPCCQALYSAPQGASALPHTGTMSASLAPPGSDCGCQPIAAAGYQGLENQLYRVEIHQQGNLTSATFKWSRENASVVTAVTSVNGAVVTVTSLGPDANLGFQAGQWVELSDDTYLFGATPNQPGTLYQIQSINPATLQVTMTAPVVTNSIDPTKNARMRRWDQTGASATSSGIPVSSAPIALENGILVNFGAGEFQPGDYWTIPARTANGQIEWPQSGGTAASLSASYIQIYQAPLACVGLRSFSVISRLGGEGGHGPVVINPYVTSDCRLLFPPLTTVNADTTPPALHVSAISWTNDDVMTVDALLQNGLSVTFDQPTTCPWGGGNFKVTLEPPLATETINFFNLPGIPAPTFPSPPGTDFFLRTVFSLDPPWGIDVSGTTVSWITPFGAAGTTAGQFWVYVGLNTLLNYAAPLGFARVCVELIGGAIYGNGTAGNIYLDGLSFGETGARAADGSESVNSILPSGNSLRVSDYKGWFYLAPTLVISALTIQLMNEGTQVGNNGVTVVVDRFNNVTGLSVTGAEPPIPVTAVQAVITFSYAPIAPANLTLQLMGTTTTPCASIQPTAVVPTGQTSLTVPITILANPGPNVDTVTLSVSVAGLFGPIPSGTQPTLAITGVSPPPRPVPIPIPIPRPIEGL